MNGSAKKIFPITIIAIFAMAFLVGIADAQPVPPWSFHGGATINGRPAPVGSVITCEIDGSTRGYRTVTEEGYYGRIMSEGGDGAILSVDPWSNGDDVLFFIQTPEMSNMIQASETGTINSADDGVTKLDLTFTGEEIPKAVSSTPSTSGSGPVGSDPAATAGGDNETGDQDEPSATITIKKINIDSELEGGKTTIELAKVDEIEFTVGSEIQTLKIKSISDFAALITVSGNDMIIGEGETITFDFDGDGFEDVSITLDNIKNNKAEFVFEKHSKSAEIESSSEMSGMLIGGVGGMAAIVVVIVAVVSIGVLKMKTRGRRVK